MSTFAPLWTFCTINDDLLSESTNTAFRFDYVDISNVTPGRISQNLEETTFSEAPSRARRLARPGDVIVSTVRTYLRAVAPVYESPRPRVYSTGFAVIRPDDSKSDSRFVRYCFTSDEIIDEIIAHSTGVSYPAINAADIARLRLPLPDLPTQRRIADYLDRETAQIDAMAGALDGLVARLEERRRALIDNQFSEVFDATRTPIWSILEPKRRLNYPSEEVLSVYRDLGVVPKSSRDDNHNVTPQDVSVYQLVNRGDVVVNKMKAWQGSVSVSNFRGIVSSDYQVAAPTVPINSRYLHHALRTSNMIRLYGIRSTGVRPSQWRLYWQDFSALSIPLPPLNEQGRIADHLDAETAKIDAMIAKAGELRALLDERRSALITATVTGQHPVPEEH